MYLAKLESLRRKGVEEVSLGEDRREVFDVNQLAASEMPKKDTEVVEETQVPALAQ